MRLFDGYLQVGADLRKGLDQERHHSPMTLDLAVMRLRISGAVISVGLVGSFVWQTRCGVSSRVTLWACVGIKGETRDLG